MPKLPALLRRIDFARIFIAVIMLSLALIYPLLWMKMMADPVLYTGTDFIAFYAAGRIADNEGAPHVYDLHLQEKYEQEIVGYDFDITETNLFIHPPFVIPLTELMVTSEYLASFRRWALLMMLVFIAGIPLLVSLTGDLLLFLEKIVFSFGLFLFFPAFLSILLGQDSAILFLGIALCLWGMSFQNDRAAGLGLALATVRPHLALFLLLPFLFKRRAVLGWFVAFSSLLALFSLAYAGVDGIAGFFRILTVSGGGEEYRSSPQDMVNFIGLARRTLPFLSPAFVRAAGWALYVLALLALAGYFRYYNEDMQRNISIAAVAAVFASPHSYVHDTLLFIIPVMTLALALLNNRIIKPGRAVLLPLGISLLLLFSYYSPLLMRSIPYFLMIALLYGIRRYINPVP